MCIDNLLCVVRDRRFRSIEFAFVSITYFFLVDPESFRVASSAASLPLSMSFAFSLFFIIFYFVIVTNLEFVTIIILFSFFSLSHFLKDFFEEKICFLVLLL